MWFLLERLKGCLTLCYSLPIQVLVSSLFILADYGVQHNYLNHYLKQLFISEIPHSLDYSLISKNIIFTPGMTGPQCQSIPITDDSILENDEMFVVSLSTTDQDIIRNPSTTFVTILDDDGNVNSKMSCLVWILLIKACVLPFCALIHGVISPSNLFCIVLL